MKKGKRILAAFLAVLMVVAIMPTSWATKKVKAATETKVYTLNANDLEAVAQGTKADGDVVKAGTDNFFSIICSAKTKFDASNKSFSDGFEGTQRINFGEGTTTAKNAIRFTTEGTATVTVWWACGDAGREVTILDKDGKAVATTSEGLAKNAMAISTITVPEAGTYYLGNTPKSNYIFKVQVSDEVEIKPTYKEVTTEIGRAHV